jgi:hypothetical protein
MSLKTIRINSYAKPGQILFIASILLLLSPSPAPSQTTALTYQGKLNDNGNPATGNYDFQFKLFDTTTIGTGTQQGSTLTNNWLSSRTKLRA